MRLAVLALIAGCGRVGFDTTPPTGDAGDDATTPPGTPALAQLQSKANFNSGIAVPLSATAPGNLLVVAIDVNSASDPIASVVDDAGDAFVSAGVRSISVANPGGNVVSEIWYAANISGGATSLTATTVGGAGLWDVTVLELSEIAAADPLETTGAADNVAGNTMNADGLPVTITHANSAIVELNSGSRLNGLAADSPFTKFSTGANDDVAYLLGDHAIATYQADWTCTMACGQYNLSAVSFRAR